jgi:hypothetical protein
MRLDSVTIPGRYCGPSDSGNGGYTCGLLAEFVSGTDVEVTLRSRPPLDRELEVEAHSGRVLLLDGERLVAEAVTGTVDVAPPATVTPRDAVDASARYAGFREHAFPNCFVCGPQRKAGDGLRIFAGPVAGHDGVVAAPWTAREVTAPVVWAAIDCPGAFAVGTAGRGELLLGRMAGRIARLPREGEECVVVGWRLHEDGRKLHAGTALLDGDGDALALGRQTWIVPKASSAAAIGAAG